MNLLFLSREEMSVNVQEIFLYKLILPHASTAAVSSKADIMQNLFPFFCYTQKEGHLSLRHTSVSSY